MSGSARDRLCRVAPEVGEGWEVVRATLSQSELGRAEFFLHGTTVGINALVERKGAAVGVLTTDGFRDVLEARIGPTATSFTTCSGRLRHRL